MIYASMITELSIEDENDKKDGRTISYKFES